LETASVSYGKTSSYLPVIDLLKGYFKISDRDDHREMRAKVMGRVLGLERALEPVLPPLTIAAWDGFRPISRCTSGARKAVKIGRSPAVTRRSSSPR
jgi:hypothetical protein